MLMLPRFLSLSDVDPNVESTHEWISFSNDPAMFHQRDVCQVFVCGGGILYINTGIPPDTHLPLESTSENISPNPYVGTEVDQKGDGSGH